MRDDIEETLSVVRKHIDNGIGIRRLVIDSDFGRLAIRRKLA